MKRVYFDCNATTAVEPAVVEAMLPYLSGEFGNAASMHAFGQKARAAVVRKLCGRILRSRRRTCG